MGPVCTVVCQLMGRMPAPSKRPAMLHYWCHAMPPSCIIIMPLNLQKQPAVPYCPLLSLLVHPSSPRTLVLVPPNYRSVLNYSYWSIAVCLSLPILLALLFPSALIHWLTLLLTTFLMDCSPTSLMREWPLCSRPPTCCASPLPPTPPINGNWSECSAG